MWVHFSRFLVGNKRIFSVSEGSVTVVFCFSEKKQDLLIRGRKGNELEELWTFVVENNVASLETMCALGMQTHDSDYNALGYSRLGVYVCRNADIATQHALIKHASTQVIRLLVCKVSRAERRQACGVSSGQLFQPLWQKLQRAVLTTQLASLHTVLLHVICRHTTFSSSSMEVKKSLETFLCTSDR